MTKRVQDKEYYAAYYERNKAKLKLQRAAWKEANIDRVKATAKAYRDSTSEIAKNYRDSHKDKLYFLSLKSRAVKKGLEFSLVEEDVLGVTVCPVFGFPLVRSSNGPSYDSPSVDRIDNTKGYVKGNIQIMSYLANSMKRDATDEQLILFAEWVLKEKKTGYLHECPLIDESGL